MLLVEDEDSVRELIREILLMGGYTVQEASRPSEALQICEQHDGPIHLLVTDLVMPEMNGQQLAERVTRIRPEAKVLYVSGYPSGTLADHGMVGARAALLQKPFSRQTLTHRVREALDESVEH